MDFLRQTVTIFEETSLRLTQLETILEEVTDSFEAAVWNSAAYLAATPEQFYSGQEGEPSETPTATNIDTDAAPPEDQAMMALTTNIQCTMWLADSGASTHMGPFDHGMFNVRPDRTEARLGNGTTLRGVKVGDRRIVKLEKKWHTACHSVEGLQICTGIAGASVFLDISNGVWLAAGE